MKSVLAADELGRAPRRAGHDRDALGPARRAAETGWSGAVFAHHRSAIERSLGVPEADGQLREAVRLNPYFSPYHAEKARTPLGEGRC
ncbi:hypothetical protein [Kitasatospora cystarginea]